MSLFRIVQILLNSYIISSTDKNLGIEKDITSFRSFVKILVESWLNNYLVMYLVAMEESWLVKVWSCI